MQKLTNMENPFVTVGKIKPEYFCDRREESARLVRQLTNGSNVVLVSPRRLGKTGLIDYSFGLPDISKHYVTISVDILRTSSLSELTYLLGRAVFRAIGSRSQRMMKQVLTTLRSLSGSFGYDPVTSSPTFDVKLGDITNPAYTLEEIFACIEQADRRCLIAIDEFQQICNYPEKNIEALLRTHIQQTANANFVFAGGERHIMTAMFHDTARPFYNSADMLMLEPIAEDKYRDFVKHHFRKAGMEATDGAISKAYQTWEGNTYYLQKTFHDIFSEMNGGDVCDVETVDTAIARMVAEGNQKYSEQLSRLSLPQKELLYAIAADRRASQITSSAFIRRHHLKSASSVQAAAKKLLEYAIISTEHNEYYVDDRLMRLWLLL